MAEATLGADVRQIVLSNAAFGPRDVKALADAMAEDSSQYRALRDAVAELELREETPASNVRLGCCLYLLGHFERAIDVLKRGDNGALAHYYLGRAYIATQKFDLALESFRAARIAGYNSDECALGEVEALRLKGNAAEALQILDRLSGPVVESAEYLFQRGATLACLGASRDEVIELYERAVQSDPYHVGALFGLGLENDRQGNDEVALELYQRCVSRFPPHLGALINLGILYEDAEQYEKAVRCYQRVLDAFPDHPRARLFLKDAQAAGRIVLDEDVARRKDRLAQILATPVTDFELSVRSRNCLQKMGIMTLGDLCRCTEQDLLASKNFGETSLAEIKEMLASKGLRLGQLLPERAAVEPLGEPEEPLAPEEEALLAKPVSELNLSVRARKCMARLGINTVGELIRKSGDELLECKNFGVTSLNEVREKLRALGLKLRGD
ncbi:MAG TPA: DNA-directed RNA polymerase subunit alpha C-terminal domain-containing protein [Thermogutta sp.]|nr:DNA-directed RNA polymerase subunit alpha C-terminal domain-containing protein [Thermogutta sp.]HPU05095.1 DNA-directed RNA polymerase subunit alpha C-terminal domain-containing protein [Thermogutta sp.]